MIIWMRMVLNIQTVFSHCIKVMFRKFIVTYLFLLDISAKVYNSWKMLSLVYNYDDNCLQIVQVFYFIYLRFCRQGCTPRLQDS